MTYSKIVATCPPEIATNVGNRSAVKSCPQLSVVFVFTTCNVCTI